MIGKTNALIKISTPTSFSIDQTTGILSWSSSMGNVNFGIWKSSSESGVYDYVNSTSNYQYSLSSSDEGYYFKVGATRGGCIDSDLTSAVYYESPVVADILYIVINNGVEKIRIDYTDKWGIISWDEFNSSVYLEIVPNSSWNWTAYANTSAGYSFDGSQTESGSGSGSDTIDPEPEYGYITVIYNVTTTTSGDSMTYRVTADIPESGVSGILDWDYAEIRAPGGTYGHSALLASGTMSSSDPESSVDVYCDVRYVHNQVNFESTNNYVTTVVYNDPSSSFTIRFAVR